MKSVTTLALLVEAILIYVSCMVVSIIDMPFVVGVDYLEWYWYLVGIIMGGLLLHPKVLSWILVRLKAKPENGLTLEYHHVLLWIGYYAAIWFLGSIILCLCIGMIYPIDPQFIFVCIAAWTVSNLATMFLYFLPGSYGLLELSQTVILSAFIPASIAIIGVILFRLCLTIIQLVSGLILYSFGEARKMLITSQSEKE